MPQEFENYGDLHDGVTGDTIRAAAADPNENANVIAALASELGEDEQHVAADVEGDIEAGTRTNPAQAQADASELAQNGYYAVGLLNGFAADVDTFDAEVEELNQRLRTMTAERRKPFNNMPDEDVPEYSETWNQVKSELRPDYITADTTLEEAAERVATMFEKGATPGNVKELILAGLIPLSVAAAQWPNIELSPTEKFEAYQEAVRNGTLPSIDDMTETERQAFLDANPDLLEEWMEVEEPSEELQETIIGLALPDVDSDDADSDVATILAGIDDDATAAEIRAAFANSGEVASGLALLLPWANRTGVDLGTHDRATNAQAYSETFGRETWEHREDIETLLDRGVEREVERTGAMGHTRTDTVFESLFSAEEAEQLRSQWAGSYLAASNEEIGGGWDSLPEDMRYDLSLQQDWNDTGKETRFVDVASFLNGAQSDLPAGDGLSLELANSASKLLDSTYGDRDGSPGGTDMGWTNTQHEELYGSLLERASLNHEATTYLLGGDPGWPSNEMPHTPEDFDHNEFVTKVYTHPWEDNGEAASSLTEWTIDPPAGSEDLADEAFNGLQETISGNQDVYEKLITIDEGPDEGKSVGESNPELMRTLALATGGRLDQFVTSAGGDGEAQTVKLFTLINSDHAQTEDGKPDPNSAAVQFGAAIQAYQQERINDAVNNPDANPNDPNAPGTTPAQVGRLFGLNSAALDNVIYSAYSSDIDAANEVAETRKAAIGLLGIVPAGDAAPVVGMVQWLAEQSIEPEDVEIPETIENDLYGNIDTGGGSSAGVETVTRGMYLQAMLDADPSLASQYRHVGIINDNGQVDLSGLSIEDTDRVNNQLSELMPSDVNEDIVRLRQERDGIANRHGLITDDEYTDAEGN